MLALIGIGCLVIGVVMLVIIGDTMLLGLSVILALLTAVRCVILYRRIGRGEFEMVEGVCINITLIPLQRRRSLTIQTDEGEETIIRTDNRSVPYVGGRYRVYIMGSSVNFDPSSLLREWNYPEAFAVEELSEDKNLQH